MCSDRANGANGSSETARCKFIEARAPLVACCNKLLSCARAQRIFYFYFAWGGRNTIRNKENETKNEKQKTKNEKR